MLAGSGMREPDSGRTGGVLEKFEQLKISTELSPTHLFDGWSAARIQGRVTSDFLVSLISDFL